MNHIIANPQHPPYNNDKSKVVDRIIRKPELLNIVGLSDVTIWRMERAGKFPKRLRLGANSCGWIDREVSAWLTERAAARG